MAWLYVTDCPAGFVSGIYREQCYFFGTESLNWSEAQNLCDSKDAYLAELIDVNERDAVFNYVRGKHSAEGVVNFLGRGHIDIL